MPSNENSTSLNKYISSTGFCSRREADKFIKAGQVTLNGAVANLGNRVEKGDTVLIDGQSLKRKEKAIYIVFNKPPGITCTTEHGAKDNIIDYIKHPQRIFPIGRLDKPSSGLILLTNNGDIVNKILRSGNQHEKEYIVKVNKKITSTFLQKMQKGIPILGTVTQKCVVQRETPFVFRITLKQGLNRQIRRMCEYLDYKVVSLKRIRIMNITIENLPLGKWRNLTKQELEILQDLIANSSKTEEASRFPKSKKRK